MIERDLSKFAWSINYTSSSRPLDMLMFKENIELFFPLFIKISFQLYVYHVQEMNNNKLKPEQNARVLIWIL